MYTPKSRVYVKVLNIYRENKKKNTVLWNFKVLFILKRKLFIHKILIMEQEKCLLTNFREVFSSEKKREREKFTEIFKQVN